LERLLLEVVAERERLLFFCLGLAEKVVNRCLAWGKFWREEGMTGVEQNDAKALLAFSFLISQKGSKFLCMFLFINVHVQQRWYGYAPHPPKAPI